MEDFPRRSRKFLYSLCRREGSKCRGRIQTPWAKIGLKWCADNELLLAWSKCCSIFVAIIRAIHEIIAVTTFTTICESWITLLIIVFATIVADAICPANSCRTRSYAGKCFCFFTGIWWWGFPFTLKPFVFPITSRTCWLDAIHTFPDVRSRAWRIALVSNQFKWRFCFRIEARWTV